MTSKFWILSKNHPTTLFNDKHKRKKSQKEKKTSNQKRMQGTRQPLFSFRNNVISMFSFRKSDSTSV